MSRLRDALDVRPEHRLLDAAAGTGQLREIAEPARYFAFDLDVRRVALAGASGGGTGSLVAADARRLCYRSSSFDRVLASGLLHHVDDDGVRGILAEFHRVLAPGGRVVILDAIWPTRWWNVTGFIGRWMDEGRHVRFADAYRALFEPFFDVASFHNTHRWSLEVIVADLRPRRFEGARG